MEVSLQLPAPASLPTGMNTIAHYVAGWIDHRTSFDILEKIKVSFPCWDSHLCLSNHYTALALNF